MVEQRALRELATSNINYSTLCIEYLKKIQIHYGIQSPSLRPPKHACTIPLA